ncbi:hypothetical protein IAD21_00809 [Abditibacteriota bacterium]|nr:hypothetical protein IAD21_00809 [Abditibacteriota bacterium]
MTKLPTRFLFVLSNALLFPSVFTVFLSSSPSSALAAPADYFRIDVVDADTGRGVPLVELKTTSEVSYYTDSNGIVAINDPELMGQNVFFKVKSHGYEYPKDGFGISGTALQLKAGGRGTIKIKRINIAERLYRITGSGIYRDSLLVGAPVPVKQPLLNGLVMGQDTVHAIPYQGKIFWLWGDTNRVSYPLGNFATSSATSLPPGRGGLDPDKGVDLTYWVDKEGFSKKMIPLDGSKPVWMGGLFTLPDDKGQTRLYGAYSQVESDSKSLEDGLAVFNDDKAVFEKVKSYKDVVLRPGGGRTFKATVGNKSYIYFSPTMRTLADYAHVIDNTTYESYTCLAPGAKFDGANTQLDRDANGRLVYGWKTYTPSLDQGREKTLIDAHKMAPEEAISQFLDIETGEPMRQVGGSVYWNAYRNRWVRITGQSMGTSVLGEIWYAEADTPTGPWLYSRKIISHDNYTFYNVTQHPFFDQDGGRLIYVEGTYTSTYSGNKEQTPRYDYNQMMYRLDLNDPRLALPVPVYRLKDDSYSQRSIKDASHFWAQVQSLPFFGMPSDGDGKSGLIPVYQGAKRLQLTAPAGATPLFYALPTQPAAGEKSNSAIVPLYEYSNARTGGNWYSTNDSEKGDGVTRSQQPIARVWRNPSTVLPLDNLTPQPETF